MSYTLDAVDVPAPIKLDSLRLRSNLTPLAGQTLSAGGTLLSTPFNKNSVYLDQLSSIGGSNICAIDPNGLAMSTSSGLTIDISAGLAFCGGAVEISSAQQLVLTGGIRNYVWVQQDGTITKTSTITPPATYCCYIGSVLCGASTITSYDLSGVLYMQGGQIIRYTGDSSVPGDTPDAGLVFYTVTDGGTYLWNGFAYCVIYPVSTGVPVDGVTIDYNGSGELEVIAVPASLITGSLGASHINCDGTTIHNSGGNLAVIVAGLTGIADSQLATAYIKQDGTRAMAADLSLGANKITNVTDPTSPQDAATKAYVDAVASGLDLKASCKLATAAALPANTFAANALTATANGALTVDGVAVTAGDRILVKNEAAALRNGIYTVTQAGSGGTPYILTRATDADTSAEVTSGMFTFISAGSTYTATSWALSTPDPITLNTTALTFVQFAGAGAYSAGTGLDLTGSVFSAKIDSTTITLTGGGALQVGAISAALVTSGTLAVARGGTGLSALGTANQIPGVNAGASALEYKSVAGTTNQITVTHGAGSITLSVPAANAMPSAATARRLLYDNGTVPTWSGQITNNQVLYFASGVPAGAANYTYNGSNAITLYGSGARGEVILGWAGFGSTTNQLSALTTRVNLGGTSVPVAQILVTAAENQDSSHGGASFAFNATKKGQITVSNVFFMDSEGDSYQPALSGTTATDGFWRKATVAGLPTGAPTRGSGAECWDSTNNATWNYCGSTIGHASTGPGRRAVSKGADYTMVGQDDIVFVDVSGGSVIITLPSAAAVPVGKLYYVVANDGLSTNTMKIRRAGSDTINGTSTDRTVTPGSTSPNKYLGWAIFSNGAGWFASAWTPV